MASYLVANYDVSNRDGYNQYLAAVGPIIAAHGGKILVAGAGSTPVEGSPGEITIVLEFPTRSALEGWYNSEEYQEIIGLRTENTDGFLVFSDEFSLPH
jgi:uncharacterized protein (DUF1330 family)